jgi:putative ABC transport system permease protein
MIDREGSPHDAPRLIRALMTLFPPDFRRRYGDAMLAFQRERFYEARRAGESRVRVWRRALGDVAITLATEWARELRGAEATYESSRAPLGKGERMSFIGREIVQTVRSLRRSVGFSAATVGTLALGIGATTAIFSVVHSVLLATLPLADPDRVVIPESKKVTRGNTWSITYSDFVDWRDNHVFASVAAYQGLDMDLTGAGDPVRVSVAAVTPQFFDALGAAPAKGRALQPVDFAVDGPRAIVISDRFWRNQFGSRSDAVGSTIEINGLKRQIVGVLPAGARWPIDVDVWVPLRFTTEQDADLRRRDNFVYQGIARLKPGVSIEQTRTLMGTLAARVAAEQPSIRKDVTTVPTPLMKSLLGPTTPRVLWILLGAVSFLLLIGCVNAANLQLARATSRHRELAVRRALGASRLRIVRQALIESGLLALAGGALGVLLARALIAFVVAAAPPDVPRIDQVALDTTALAFALASSVAVALIFGVVPAVHAARGDPQVTLADGGTRASGRRGAKTRRTLVVVELALSVILLCGAGLATRSIIRLRGEDTGFQTRDVLTASISLPGIRYDTKAKVVSFIYGLRDRIAASAGVDAAGIASASPLGAGGFYLGRMMVAEGREPSPATEVQMNWNVATPGYFAALGMPIARGRDFTARDDSASAPVMIVNEHFANAMFPGEDPIGKRAMSSRDEKVEREIVGVVRDVKYYGARDTARSLVWVPFAQNAWHQGIITVRTRGAPAAALALIKRELRTFDGSIALANVTTMDDALARSMASNRFVAILLAGFAGLAVLLAAVGVLGVLSYTVERRTHELGIRVALGAARSDVMRLVMTETLGMAAVGVGLGLGGALGLTRLAQSILYQVSANDPLTFATVGVVLAAVAVIAAIVPARRAARVDPAIALRSE